MDCQFPGGNIVLERIEQDHVYLRQDQRDTPGFWFYWCFRVRGAEGRTLWFHFTGGQVIGVRGPAVSTDGGKTWAWLGRQGVQGPAFTYTFPRDAEEVRFAMAMPYLEADLDAFLLRHASSPHLKVETLCQSRKGRRNVRLHVGKLDAVPEHRVLLACRHHACESMASWVLEGMLDTVLSDPDDGAWFREHVEILAIPFVDKDGVEDGDQGKNRQPHDPNRDYLGQSIYPSVAAIRQVVPPWSEGRLRVALDLHCPYLSGGGDRPGSNERLVFVGNPSDASWAETLRFCEILRRTQRGPLVYDPKHNLPWGQGWNTSKDGLVRSFSHWAAQLPGVRMASTLETPYADVAGQAVTPDSARALGNDLIRALRQYLQQLDAPNR